MKEPWPPITCVADVTNLSEPSILARATEGATDQFTEEGP
jgi:hypothetical protein